MLLGIDSEKCMLCGECDLVCPMDVIHFNAEEGIVEIRHRDDCMTCFNCELACSTGAIFVDPVKKEKIQPW